VIIDLVILTTTLVNSKDACRDVQHLYFATHFAMIVLKKVTFIIMNALKELKTNVVFVFVSKKKTKKLMFHWQFGM